MMRASWTVVVISIGCLLGSAAAVRAEGPEIPSPHLYVSPTVGIWRWDPETLGAFEIDSRSGLVLGLRAGYSPFEAISGEVIFLRGTNSARAPEALGFDGDPDVTLTQIELSFVVNFRSLIVSRWYPFVDVGAGVALRDGDLEFEMEKQYDGTQVAFHLGGGVKVDLGSRATLRVNLRDTFYTETIRIGAREEQNTIDAVEISAGLDYRIPLGRVGRPDRLR